MHTSEDVVYIRVIPLKELQQMQKQLAILALISPNLLNLLSITPSSRDYSLQVHPPVLYLQKQKVLWASLRCQYTESRLILIHMKHLTLTLLYQRVLPERV